MNELILYLLKSTFSLSLLYLAFRTMMRKEVFFALNRSMLLAIVIFSFIIPLLHLPSTVKPIIQEQVIQQVSFYNNETEPTTAVENINYGTPASIQVADQQEAPLPFSKEKIITLIYLAGMLFSFLVFIHGILSVLLLLGKAKAVRKDGYLIFILEKDIPAFSFWKLIFISKTDYMENGTTILTHEIQHIRLGHFYDLMLMEMVKMIHWFNPVIYWLIQDMKAIHEFQADQHTLSKGIDVNKYQLLIIEKGVGSQRFALANSFNHCQIKKRITMMNNSKNGKAGMWKVATFLPLLALLLMAFGRTGENVEKTSPTGKVMLDQEKTIVTELATQSKDSVYNIAEVTPEFPGGDKALRKYISENVKYPAAATKANIQGKVFVAFVVTSQGKIINPKVVRSVSPELDAEALRVIQIMPNWTPAKDKGKPVSMSYTVPINFVLYPDPTNKNVPVKSTSQKGMQNQEKSNEIKSAMQSKDSIYNIVEVMPQFPGGDKALQKFLNENMKYPKEASAKHIQGKVFVSFIINKEGKIQNPKVTRGVDPLLDNEALRVVKLMPNWIPAKDKGKTVSISYALPLNFVLE